MKIEERINIQASAEQVFDLYLDVDGWSSWDPDVEFSSISEGLTVGAKGYLKPSNGPQAKVEVTEVTPNRTFTVASRLPLCQMMFEHVITPAPSGVDVLHSIRFSGPLAPIFSRLIGRGVQKGLPKTMAGLKAHAEREN